MQVISLLSYLFLRQKVHLFKIYLIFSTNHEQLILLILIIADSESFHIKFNNMLQFDLNNISFHFRNYYTRRNFRFSVKNNSMNRSIIQASTIYILSQHFYLQPKHKNRNGCNCFSYYCRLTNLCLLVYIDTRMNCNTERSK